MMSNENFVRALGISYSGVLKNSIKKKKGEPLRPIYEAFSNAWESLKEKHGTSISDGRIQVGVFIMKQPNLLGEESLSFDKIKVRDSGVGLDRQNYERLKTLRDDSKGPLNFGTGRVQYIHFFGETRIETVFKDDACDTGFGKMSLVMSKDESFLRNNAIIRVDEKGSSESDSTYCEISFYNPLTSEDRKFFEELTIEDLKKALLDHFLSLFCDNRDFLPQIEIIRVLGEVEEKDTIQSKDVPEIYSNLRLDVPYSRKQEGRIIRTDRNEQFRIKSFVLPESRLEKNELVFVSKGEAAKSCDLTSVSKKETIAGNRYLFLLSGDYLDRRDADARGSLALISKKEFKEHEETGLLPEEVVLVDDIKEIANDKILFSFPEIKNAKTAKEKNLEELRDMFLLNDKTIDMVRSKIKANSSDQEILSIIYTAERRDEAEQDAEIKRQREKIRALNPEASDYQNELKRQVDAFVQEIPLQNRAALTRYIARRKLVLDVFDDVLNKELDSLPKTGRINEAVLHNLIFQQHSEKPTESDLWLLNEDFIYFEGVSDIRLASVKIDGKNLFKEDSSLTVEEREYREKLNRDAGDRRPDILLFPKEGKCIIVELKAPDVNVSDHLNQIARYAALINNLSSDEFIFHSYYGYLLGEALDEDDVRDADADFKLSYDDILVRPHKAIRGKFGRAEGALYMEVLKYSSLLKRAKQRNRIFIEKLEAHKN